MTKDQELLLTIRERDEARAERDSLLAVIHRDGGHYAGEHGVTKAVADAHATWAAVVRERDDARAEEEAKALGAKLSEAQACLAFERVTVAELKLEVERLRGALKLLWEEATDESRCAVERSAGDYAHHLSNPCRELVRALVTEGDK